VLLFVLEDNSKEDLRGVQVRKGLEGLSVSETHLLGDEKNSRVPFYERSDGIFDGLCLCRPFRVKSLKP
jgi:hypothetical protein